MVSGFYSTATAAKHNNIQGQHTKQQKGDLFLCGLPSSLISNRDQTSPANMRGANVQFPTKTCQRAKPDPNTWRFNFNPLWNVICHIIKPQTSMVAEDVLHSFIKCEDEIDT